MIATVSRLDYCQFLIGAQINYTCTYMADHVPKLSHDAVRSYLKRDKITAAMVWEQAQGQVVTSPNGYLVFDDTVADKNHLREIELVSLYAYTHKTLAFPDQPPTLNLAVLWIAMLGGFLARNADGPPGTIVIWRGIQRLADIAASFAIFKNVGNG